MEAGFSELATRWSAAAEGKPAHAHPLWQCQLRTFKRSLGDLGRGTTSLPVFPKARQHRLPHPKSSTSVSPKTILPFGSSVHGTMRAAARGSAVTSRSSPAPDGEGVGRPTCSRGFGTTGRAHPAGYAGGALGSVAATPAAAAGALPEPRRSDALLCPRLSHPPAPPASPPPAPRAPPSPPLALGCRSCGRLLLSLPPPLALYPLSPR